MTLTVEASRRVTATDGVGLAVYEDGPEGAPVVVFVHGYPDNHHVWDGVALEMASDHRVVRYDVRGIGESSEPEQRSGYRIEQLVNDLATVIEATSPDRPVHLVAHDWGSIQVWDALTADAIGDRVRTFTSVSGPSLDYAAVWLRAARQGPISRLRQLLASYYIALFLTPKLPELMVRLGVIQGFIRMSAVLAAPTKTPATARYGRGPRELVNGIELYRANMIRRARQPQPPRIDLPVQVVTPSHDIHVLRPLASQAPAPFVTDLTVTPIRGNHWVVAQRPDEIARLVRAFMTTGGANSPA